MKVDSILLLFSKHPKEEFRVIFKKFYKQYTKIRTQHFVNKIARINLQQELNQKLKTLESFFNYTSFFKNSIVEFRVSFKKIISTLHKNPNATFCQ